MLLKLSIGFLVLFTFFGFGIADQPVDYSGHKVITLFPQKKSHIGLVHRLRSSYNVDLWNEPRTLNTSIMMRLHPQSADFVLQKLKKENIPHYVAFHDLQSAIEEEKRVMFAPTNQIQKAFDFGGYNRLEQIEALLKDLSTSHSNIMKLETVGQTFENRPIYGVRISGGGQFGTKPAILMECGIHAREWTSVAAGAYLVNKLVTEYGSNQDVKTVLDKYELYIVPEANPDGYVYSYTVDRMWRKTRSRSTLDWLGNCRGTDANRNFDIEHCGVGTSRTPCSDIFCGDKPFSESEARALRDLMVDIGTRLEAYFSVHAFSQLWMTPYGIHKQLPTNYDDLYKVGAAGVTALQKRYGTVFRVGSIANIIYEAAGSSVDYAYVKHNVKMSFALELRDEGRRGFILPKDQILPACEETFDGLVGAMLAL